MSSLVEDEMFDIDKGTNVEKEEEEIVSETTTTITILALIVVRRTEPEQGVIVAPVVEKEERRSAVVGWGDIEIEESEEVQPITPSSMTRRRRRRRKSRTTTTIITVAPSPRTLAPSSSWLKESKDDESSDILPLLGSLAIDALEHIREANDFQAISRWVAQLPRSGHSLYEQSLRSTICHEAISGGSIGIVQGNGEVEIGPLGRGADGEDRIWDMDSLWNFQEETTD